MYCGTCLRDNSLAAALMKLGHDVTLLPLYTPTLTDEANVSNEKVFFGGISVYLEQNYALFRKTPWLLDKLWDSKAALKHLQQNLELRQEFLAAKPSDDQAKRGVCNGSASAGSVRRTRTARSSIKFWTRSRPGTARRSWRS